MKTALRIDRAGRIILPHQVRRRLRLSAGDRLEMRWDPQGIYLRAPSPPTGLIREGGLLAHDGETESDLTDIVNMVRADRDASNLEWWP